MSLQQRQYNVRNCRIVLEGLSNDPNNTGIMDILMTAECHFTGIDQVLSGGKMFWENLVKAVNIYAQECLSGLRHPLVTENGEDLVLLTKNPEKFTHHLTWQPKQEEGSEETKEKIELELNTVQIFDLIEAIDQFFADTTTLPEIKQHLEPLSKRYRRPDEPIVQRATPPILGLVSVALAGFAFFVMPIPEPKKTEPQPQGTTTENVPQTGETPKKSEPIPPGTEKTINLKSKPEGQTPKNGEPQPPK